MGTSNEFSEYVSSLSPATVSPQPKINLCVFQNTNITAISAGHGTLTICDSEGVIHLVNRNFQVTTFQGYLINVYLAAQPKSEPILITIGVCLNIIWSCWISNVYGLFDFRKMKREMNL